MISLLSFYANVFPVGKTLIDCGVREMIYRFLSVEAICSYFPSGLQLIMNWNEMSPTLSKTAQLAASWSSFMKTRCHSSAYAHNFHRPCEPAIDSLYIYFSVFVAPFLEFNNLYDNLSHFSSWYCLSYVASSFLSRLLRGRKRKNEHALLILASIRAQFQ